MKKTGSHRQLMLSLSEIPNRQLFIQKHNTLAIVVALLKSVCVYRFQTIVLLVDLRGEG